jgi:hypothetical protein
MDRERKKRKKERERERERVCDTPTHIRPEVLKFNIPTEEHLVLWCHDEILDQLKSKK